MPSLKDRVREQLVQGVAKIASGMIEPDEFNPTLASKVMVQAARNVGLRLRLHARGGVSCPLCGRGPFMPKGYYLHLVRVHPRDILDLIDREAERLSSAARRLG